MSTNGTFRGSPTAVVVSGSGTIGLYVRTASGIVMASGQAAPRGAFGPWNTIGGSTVASDPTAVLATTGGIRLYVSNTSGGISGTDQSTPGAQIGDWKPIG